MLSVALRKGRKVFFYSTTTTRYFWDPTSPHSSKIWRKVVDAFRRNVSIDTVTYTWFYTYISLTCLYDVVLNHLNPELNPICYLLALLGAHHFLHVSRIRVKLLTFRRLMSYIYIYIYGAPILDVARSHTTTQHSR